MGDTGPVQHVQIRDQQSNYEISQFDDFSGLVTTPRRRLREGLSKRKHPPPMDKCDSCALSAIFDNRGRITFGSTAQGVIGKLNLGSEPCDQHFRSVSSLT